MTFDLAKEDEKNLNEIFHNLVNNSSYSLTDLETMDYGRLLDVNELVSKDIQRKIDAAKR